MAGIHVHTPSASHSPIGEVEKLIEVPCKLVTSNQAFSIDFGGSVIKLVYRTEEDYVNALQSGEDGTGHLRLVSYARGDLDKALHNLETRAYTVAPPHGDGGLRPSVHTTGNGCSQYREVIEDKLKCRMTNLTEFDCLVSAFQLLASTQNRRQFLHPPATEAMHEALDSAKHRVEHWKGVTDSALSKSTPTFSPECLQHVNSWRSGEQPDLDRPITQTENIYPCVIASLGSLFNLWLVEADGSFRFLDGSDMGGLAFYGLGTLLTGCKTFTELVTLASSGDPLGVNVGGKDMMAGRPDDGSIYSRFGRAAVNHTLFPFGKAVGASIGDFAREDLAAALLRMTVTEAGLVVQTVAEEAGCRRVFLLGSFTSTPLVRSMLASCLAKRSVRKYIAKGKSEGLRFDFLQDAGHLGCIGALIKHLDQ